MMNIDIENGSMVVNCTGPFAILFIALFVHISSLIVVLILKAWKWKPKWSEWILKQLNLVFKCSFYIVHICESFLLFLICTISEVSEFDTSYKTSLVFSIWTAILLGMLLLVIAVHYTKYYKSESTIFIALYEDTKPTKEARIYPVLFMVHRLLLVWAALLLTSLHKRVILAFLIVIHLVFTCYVTKVRPFKSKIDNVLEVINSILYLLLLVHITIFTQESQYKGDHSSVLVTILFAHGILTSLFIFCIAVIFIIMKLIEVWSKNKKETTTVSPVKKLKKEDQDTPKFSDSRFTMVHNCHKDLPVESPKNSSFKSYCNRTDQEWSKHETMRNFSVNELSIGSDMGHEEINFRRTHNRE